MESNVRHDRFRSGSARGRLARRRGFASACAEDASSSCLNEMDMKMNRAQQFLIGVVVVHAAVTGLHAVAHTRIDVLATVEQSVFIGTVIILAPLIAAVGQLMRRD